MILDSVLKRNSYQLNLTALVFTRKEAIMFSLPLPVRLFVIIVLAFSIGGCASMVGHHKVEDLYGVALGSSPARTYQATFEEARQAALYSMQQTGMENIAEHPKTSTDWFITGEIKYSWRSNGQFVRVSVSAIPGSKPAKTQAFYHSVKRFEMNVTENLEVIRDKVLNLMDSYIESL
jgi:hypothetical protein